MEDHEFERLLKVARLKLTDVEKGRIKADIEEVIGYFDSLDQMESGEEPAYHPIKVPARLRKDEVVEFTDIDALKRQAKLHDGYILGPKL